MTKSSKIKLSIAAIGFLIVQLLMTRFMLDVNREKEKNPLAADQVRQEIAGLKRNIAGLDSNLKELSKANSMQTEKQELLIGNLLDNIKTILKESKGNHEEEARRSAVKKALDLAEESEKKGDLALAKQYYLNAITRDPGNFKILKEFYEKYLVEGKSVPDEIEGFRSILEISLYHASPENIIEMLALSNKADELMAATEEVGQSNLVAFDPKAEFKRVCGANMLDASWRHPKKLATRIESLSDMLEMLEVKEFNAASPDSETSKLQKMISDELELSQRVALAAQYITGLNAILDKIPDAEKHPEKALSLLQTSESMISQLWVVDSQGFPPSMLDEMDKLPKGIRAEADKIINMKSEEALSKIRQAWDRASERTYGREEVKINRVREELNIALQAAQGIQNESTKKNAEMILERFNLELQRLGKQQLEDYQKWAIEQCVKAFKKWDDYTVGSEEKAVTSFKAGDLASIDQRILTPETSRAVNDVLQILLGKMGNKKRIEIEQEMVVSKKRPLSDF